MSRDHRPLFRFENMADPTFDAVSRVPGEGTRSDAPEECGNGVEQYLVWDGELTIGVRDRQIIGWQLPDGSTLTSLTGLGLGSTVADLRAEIGPVAIEETTLGWETVADAPLETGGYSALLTGPDPDDTVAVLWAGSDCVFR